MTTSRRTKAEYLQDAIAAIKILKQVSHPNEEEREILFNFPGGGILKEAGLFNGEDKPEYLRQAREEIKDLLTEGEWEDLQNSGLQNAHYTLPAVRQAMWEAIAPLIPQVTGKRYILDPGCGMAGFFRDMPVGVGDYIGIDKDSLTAALATKAVNGQARIFNKDFLQYRSPVPHHAAIGNVPFTNGVNHIKVDGMKLRVGIHAQFFIKSIQLLAPGAPLCFLTSINTLDSRIEDFVKFRKWVSSKCEFIGALRLPMDVTHAGSTEVTTDLILLRRRERDMDFLSYCDERDWISVGLSGLFDYANNPVHLNQWYIDNPQYLLGEMIVSQLRGKNGNPATTLALKSREGQDFQKELRERLALLTQERINKRVRVQEKIIEIGEKSMGVSIISADKFQSTSIFSFILHENPAKEGMEIHFHPEHQAKTQSEIDFMGRLVTLGFTKAKANQNMYYRKYDGKTMEMLRNFAKKCEAYGAYELDPGEIVGEIKTKFRKKAATPQQPTQSTPAIPIVDAIAEKLSPMFSNLPEQVAALVLNGLKSQEIDNLNERLKSLEQQNEQLRQEKTQVEKLYDLESRRCDSFASKLSELEKQNQLMRSQLAQFGICEPVEEIPEPILDDELPAVDLSDLNPGLSEPSFDDLMPETVPDPNTCISTPTPSPTPIEEDGFGNLDEIVGE